MNTTDTKDKKEKAAVDFGCMPGDFKKMFGMMGKCCPERIDSLDCSAMKDMCCGSKPDTPKSDQTAS